MFALTIDWLDVDMTEARVIKGWWRRRSAILKRTQVRRYDSDCNGYDGYQWFLKYSGQEAHSRKLESARKKVLAQRKKAEKDRDWVEIQSLPKAYVLGG